MSSEIVITMGIIIEVMELSSCSLVSAPELVDVDVIFAPSTTDSGVSLITGGFVGR